MIKSNYKLKTMFSIIGIGIALSSNSQTVDQALKMVDNEQFANAKKTLYQITNSNPTNSDAFYYLGDFLLKQDKNIDSAKINFDKALTLNPKSALALVGQGAIAFAKGNNTEAQVQFDMATKVGKKNSNVFLAVAQSYATKKETYDNAIATLQKAIVIDPKNTDALLLLGDVNMMKDNNANEAVKYYSRAKTINPKLAKAHIKEGKLYLKAKNYNEALKYYNNGKDAQPDYSPAYRELGELYSLAGQNAKALENYKKYMSLSDGSEETHYRYASFLFLNKNYNESLAELNNLGAGYQSNFYVSRLKGYSNYEIGNYTLGLEQINNFFKIVPEDKIIASDYEYLGKLQTKTDNDSLGLVNIMKAVEMDTNRLDVLNEQVKISMEDRNYGRAAKIYTSLFKYKNPGANDLLNYGKTFYFSKQYKKSDSVFAKLIELKPDQILGYKYRALTNRELDPEFKTGAALPYYEKYAEIAAIDPEKNKKDLIDANSYFGQYAIAKNDVTKAKQYWTKVKELDPTNENANNVLKALDKVKATSTKPKPKK